MTTTTTTTIATTPTGTASAVLAPRPSPLGRLRDALGRRWILATSGDAGMSTVEYAVGTVAAAAFGAVLYMVVSGDSIPDALGGIIQRALTTSV